MLGFAQTGQMRVNDRGDRAFVAKVHLDLTQVLAAFQQMRRIRMSQRVDVRLLFHAAGVEGEAEGALERGVAHRLGGRGSALAIVTLGGKEQRGMTMRFPLLAQPQERALRQGHVTILIALAAANVQEPPFGINVADLPPQPFAQSQAAGVNEDEADALIQRGHRGQNAAGFGHGEDDREFELRIGANQFQFVRPDTVERFLPEELDGADGLGAGLAGDLFVRLELNAILANLLGRDQLGGFGVELTELAEAGVVSLFGAWADGQEFEIIGEGF